MSDRNVLWVIEYNHRHSSSVYDETCYIGINLINGSVVLELDINGARPFTKLKNAKEHIKKITGQHPWLNPIISPIKVRLVDGHFEKIK